jgi:hypothetical protein
VASFDNRSKVEGRRGSTPPRQNGAMMGVDQDRRDTARQRRALVIEALSKELDPTDPSSAITRVSPLLASTRTVVANADIDGLVSSMMVGAVADWRIGVLVDKDSYRAHPSLVDAVQSDIGALNVVGIDVYSTGFPNVSNHPVIFGGVPSDQPWGHAVAAHDQLVQASAVEHAVINPSLWAGVSARLGSAHAQGFDYKYPLGTAQILLAVLESLGRSPRFFDRQYLPWLVANCDGGIETIRAYAWNAETWWSALAAAVGPASNSESLYRLATTQRPSEFLDADRRLRWEEPDRSRYLNSKWNLVAADPEALSTIVAWITDLSGWPDPFLGGCDSLDSWVQVRPERGVLQVQGITNLPIETLQAQLSGAASAIHMNFSRFRERGTALGWMGAVPTAARPLDELPFEESGVGDPESNPDVGIG